MLVHTAKTQNPIKYLFFGIFALGLSAFLFAFAQPAQANNCENNHNPTPLIVNQTPAAFLGETLKFTAENSFDIDGDNLNYLWAVNQLGIQQTGANFSFIPPNVGDYIVTLVVSDSCGGWDVKWIKVSVKNPYYCVINKKPKSVINTSSLNVVAGETVYLDGIDSSDPENAGLNYLWAVNQLGIQESDQSFEFTPEDPGDYVVTLVVGDPCGEWDVSWVNIHVEPEVEQLPLLEVRNIQFQYEYNGHEYVITYEICNIGTAPVIAGFTNSIEIEGMDWGYSTFPFGASFSPEDPLNINECKTEEFGGLDIYHITENPKVREVKIWPDSAFGSAALANGSNNRIAELGESEPRDPYLVPRAPTIAHIYIGPNPDTTPDVTMEPLEYVLFNQGNYDLPVAPAVYVMPCNMSGIDVAQETIVELRIGDHNVRNITIPPLADGECYPVPTFLQELSQPLPGPGDYQVTATYDPENIVIETDTSNNTVSELMHFDWVEVTEQKPLLTLEK